MQKPICSISIDLDTIQCYEQIHGLPVTKETGTDPIYTVAMPRFLELFKKWNIRATFFVVGRDVIEPAHAAILREAVEHGHELANHTYSHPYHFTRLSEHELFEEVIRADRTISGLLPDGQRVVGFRCPGYHITPAVLRVLRQEHYKYDSSIFPCPPYLLARAAMIGWIKLRGRESRSLMGSVETLWTPTQPYHPGFNPHRKGTLGDLWELPMSVVPGLRLPYIGTFIYLYPKRTLKHLTQLVARTHPLLNFEWHGVDILDANDPGVDSIVQHQHDIRVPLDEKLERMEICLHQIATTHTFRPLCESLPKKGRNI